MRTEWTRRASPWPPLFEALSDAPRCLTGLLRMRAVAGTAAAAELYQRFESRLSGALGRPGVEWPEGFGAFTSRPQRARDPLRFLPRIAPQQVLMLTGPLSRLDADAADLYTAALETSFGEDAVWPVPDEVLLRLLCPRLPEAWRSRWRDGLGLEPPSVWEPPTQAATEASLARLVAGDPVGTDLDPRSASILAFTFTTIELGAELDTLPLAATPLDRLSA